MSPTFNKFFVTAIVAIFASVAAATPVAEAAAQASSTGSVTVPALTNVVPHIPDSPQDFNVGTVCIDANLSGQCGPVNVRAIPSPCGNFIASFNDAISSITVISGISCTFFVDPSCKGASVVVANGQTAVNFAGTNFENSLSSVSCVAF